MTKDIIVYKAITNFQTNHCYKISLGGSDVLGMYGYLEVYRELLENRV